MELRIPGGAGLATLMSQAPRWVPLEVKPFEHQHLDVFGNRRRYVIEGVKAFELMNRASTARTAQGQRSVVADAVTILSQTHASTKHLVSSKSFERDLLAWLEELPPVSDALLNPDPVLLLWGEGDWYNPTYAAKLFEVDVTDEELTALRGWTPRGASILPRGVAQAAVDTWGTRTDVLEVVGTLVASQAEAETVLGLWDVSEADAPMRSFTHAREVARAL